MALWKETVTPPKKETPTMTPEPVFKRESEPFTPEVAPIPSGPRRAATREARESVIAADITIEGKIDGAGHVRLAGRFKGDVNIQGDLTIEAGAKLTGSVRANSVAIAGEVEGNIESASRVELLETGVLNGDLKAGTLTVAAGSRMRGRAEFGWGDELATGSKSTLSLGTSHAS
ncbi:MAG TPA: polymer-forming cytoskeletal protein [Gemmatimonadaceae bacterium]